MIEKKLDYVLMNRKINKDLFHGVFLEVLSKNVLLLLRAIANFKTCSRGPLQWSSYLIFC